MEISDPEQLQSFVKPSTVAGMVKASLAANGRSVLQMVQQGINRPGAMERAINGLTTKVLNERLKTRNYGILQRYAYPEIPPRRYKLTAFGEKFVHILNEIEKLKEIEHGLIEHSLEEIGLHPRHATTLTKQPKAQYIIRGCFGRV